MRHRRLKIIYLLLFALLIIFRMLFEGGESKGGIWNIFQGIFVVSGVFFLVKNYSSILRLPPVKTFVLFSLYIWLLCIPTLIDFSISTLFYFVVVPYGAMSMVVFYYLNGKTDLHYASFIVIAAFYVIAALFFVNRRASYISDVSEMAANAYYVVCLLPIALLYHPKKYSYIPFIVTFIVVLLSGKRAGLLALALMLIIFYYNPKQGILRQIRSILLLSVISFVVIFIYSYFRNQYGVDVFSRIGNLAEDGGSGRDRIWTKVLLDFIYSNPLQMLFGHGYGSVAELRGGQAHNDFIQVLYEYGLFALIMYVTFYVRLYKTWLRMKRCKFPYAKHFLLILIVALFMANFSFFIVEPRIILCCSLCWGLMLSEWRKYILKINSL